MLPYFISNCCATGTTICFLHLVRSAVKQNRTNTLFDRKVCGVKNADVKILDVRFTANNILLEGLRLLEQPFQYGTAGLAGT